MLDESRARSIAQQTLRDSELTLGDARELRDGWFFRIAQIGSNGVIVNKRTGRVLRLGSAFPIDRDLVLYDQGYQFERYDLVILAIYDVKAARKAIGNLALQVVTPTYEHGQIWRVPRSMTDLEIWSSLEKLPCIFPATSLYFRLEVLEEARRARWFDFEEEGPGHWVHEVALGNAPADQRRRDAVKAACRRHRPATDRRTRLHS